jgi:hypothetical protein
VVKKTDDECGRPIVYRLCSKERNTLLGFDAVAHKLKDVSCRFRDRRVVCFDSKFMMQWRRFWKGRITRQVRLSAAWIRQSVHFCLQALALQSQAVVQPDGRIFIRIVETSLMREAVKQDA